ncbi:MAG: hypothetical protein K2W95_02555 [Candidatus Obscuribacterales bacterium]|nr:hypothetical protein [Candidatus Obscuribacterales bacterium]
MAQRKPEEQSTFDQVLKLVENLTPDAQEQLVGEMKLKWLRRELSKAEESVAQGRVLTEEQLEARLDAKRREISEREQHQSRCK